MEAVRPGRACRGVNLATRMVTLVLVVLESVVLPESRLPVSAVCPHVPIEGVLCPSAPSDFIGSGSVSSCALMVPYIIRESTTHSS